MQLQKNVNEQVKPTNNGNGDTNAVSMWFKEKFSINKYLHMIMYE